jgi:hypothetical protein
MEKTACPSPSLSSRLVATTGHPFAEANLMNRPILFGFTLSVSLALGSFLPLAAQDKDERAAREEVARQALEQQITSLLKQADKLKEKPEEALALLQKASKLLDENPGVLAFARKSSLLDAIETKTKALKNPPAKPEAPATGGSGKEDDYQQQLNQLNQLRKQGREAEAKELAEKLRKQYPDRSSSILSQGSTSMAEQARQQNDVSRAKANGRRAAMSDIDDAASKLPPDGVISYPKNWNQIKKRDEFFANKISPEEKKLLQLLDETTKEPMQFKDTPFDQVLKYLEDSLNLKLVINKATLDEVQLDYSRPITVNIPKGLNKRSVLKLVLGDLDLAYVIKDKQLVVMTAQRAAKEVVTKPYYLKDLRGTALQQVANMIENSIEPNSWRKAGGPGHIVVDDKNGVLWITNTAEIVGRIFNR